MNIYVYSVQFKLLNKWISVAIVHSGLDAAEPKDQELRQVMEHRLAEANALLVFVDFNHFKVEWDAASCPCSTSRHALTWFREQMDLTQHLRGNTGFRSGQYSPLLYLVITNFDNDLQSSQCLVPLLKSDHVMNTFTFQIWQDIASNIWKLDVGKLKATADLLN